MFVCSVALVRVLFNNAFNICIVDLYAGGCKLAKKFNKKHVKDKK